MKRVFIRAAALLLVAATFTFFADATPTTSASAHILMDANTGAILSQNNMHCRSLIASTTKIMTAVIVLENMETDRIVTIPKEAVGVEGSSMYLQEGEKLRIYDLLCGLMLHSGNDAAVALGILCGGDVSTFVEMMNRKAQELSLYHTHFENPNGLDGEEHYSTAYDLGILTSYALKIPAFRQLVSCKEIKIGSRYLRNHNRLLWMDDSVIGVKTGYTKAAGRILVSAVEHEGRTLVAVTIRDSNDWQDHLALYTFGRSCYRSQILFSNGSYLGQIPLMDGTMGALYAREALTYSVMEGEKPVLKIRYPIVPMGSRGFILFDVYIGDLLIGKLQGNWEVQYNGENTKDHILPGSLFPSYCRTVDH